MMNCWQSEPGARPSFNDLTQQLKRMEKQHKVRLNSKLCAKEFSKFCLLRKGVAFVRKMAPLIVLHQAGKSF